MNQSRLQKPTPAPRILLVDDNPAFRRVIRSILSSKWEGVRISEAEDEDQTRAAVCGARPDVVFMDIKLARGNGIDLAAKLLQDDPAMAIVMVTNYDTEEYRRAASAAGAAGFLSKRESNPEDIVRAAAEILQRTTRKDIPPERPAETP
jgi:DNA-binding NarL/FixJ family response regulator